MISSIAWVRRGVADPNPKRYEMSAVEAELLQSLQKHATIGEDDDIKDRGADDDVVDDNDEDNEQIKAMALSHVILGADDDNMMAKDDADPAEEKEDNDNEALEEDSDVKNKSERRHGEDDDDNNSGDDDDDLEDVPDTREYTPLDMAGLEAMGLTRVGMETDFPELGDDDASENEDVRIGPDDALIVVAKTEDDFATLEVHCYDEKSGNLFVHHDIALPSFPLCLAHGQVCNDRTGNFCAVGTFDPGVEIWNLDVLNALEPICVLGGQDTSMTDDIMRMQVLGEKAKMSKFQTPEGLRPGSHTDAVMCLSWNNVHKHVIASGSADTTVKLWDVTKGNTNGANASTFTHHSDKVQALAWNPAEGTLLATGSFDRTVALVDARSDGRNVKSFKTVADCESIAWDPFATERLTVVTEDGTMACWDVRNLKTPLWSKEISAFGGTTDISFNQHVKGLAVTCSIDKTVTLWDLHGSEPYSCGSKDMCSGKLYTVGFYPSSPWLLGCGGGGNQLALWDLSSEVALQKRFADRLKSGSTTTSADAPAVAASGESQASTPMADSFLNADAAAAVDDAPPADSSNTTSTRQKKKKGSSKKKIHKRRG